MTIEENGIIFHSANSIFQYFVISNLKIYLNLYFILVESLLRKVFLK